MQAKSYIYDIAPYKTGKTAREAGITPIKLSSNENPYGACEQAIAAYQLAASQLHRYPDGSCALLRDTLAALHTIPAERIVCGAGSDELINLLVHTYAGSTDEVLYSAHGFLMYPIYTKAHGATPVTTPEVMDTTYGLIPDVDALLNAITPRTRLLFLACPNNPTGGLLPLAELMRLHAHIPPHVLLVIDGAYAEYLEDDYYTQLMQHCLMHENIVMLRTFSKIYGLPALRLGWMLAPAPVCDAIHRIRSPFNVNSAAQAAGVAALNAPDFINTQRTLNAHERTRCIESLHALGLTPLPTYANFVLADTGSINRAEMINKALQQHHIYVRDVAAYGLPSYLRISIGTAEEMQKLYNVLRDAC